jgi:transcriptional regulator with XRE-family HTH domain
MINNVFAKKLKELRQAKGWTQQRLADAAGMNRVQIARLEAEDHSPTWSTVLWLAKALDVSVVAFSDEAGEQVMKAEPLPDPDPSNDPEDSKIPKKGIRLAHEALNYLTRIPKNDHFRKRGFQIVTDWIKAQK